MNLNRSKKLFKSFLRITITPNLLNVFKEIETSKGRSLTKKEKESIRDLYPPVVINKYPDEFTCSCNITREATAVTQMVLSITNLSAYIRLHLLNAKYNKITVEAGYLGLGWRTGQPIDESDLSIIFKGSILWMGTQVEARKNITTQFVCISGTTESLEAYSGLMAMNYQAGYNLYQLIHEVYVNASNPDIKLNLSENDANKLLETTTGAIKPHELGSILKNFSIDMTYDWEGTDTCDLDDYINLNSSDSVPEEDAIHNINENTGLIDMPSLQGERTIKFKMLFNSNIKIFDYIKLNNYDIQLPMVEDASGDSLSKANSGYYLDPDGIYRINRLDYSLSTRGSDFFIEVTAVAKDIYSQVTGSH